MKLGVMVEGQEGLTWDRWLRIVSWTEELGFESIWRSDHLVSLLDGEREALETWVSLAVAARESTRLAIGPLVCPISFRHPSMVAKMAAAVDQLSGGRLTLGLGAGWNDWEHRAFGIPFPSPRERMERLEEGIEVILRLFGEGPSFFAGQYYELAGVNAQPKPFGGRRMPLLIGGMGGKRFLDIVARHADEWNLTTNSPALYRKKSEQLLDHCRAVGRDPDEIRRSVAVGILIGGSSGELERRCEVMRGLIPYLAAVSVAEVPDAVRAAGWVAGSPDQITARLLELRAEGIDRAMLQLNDHDDLGALELIAREVMPAVGQ